MSTYEQQERRAAELRAEDLHGIRSNSDIERTVLGEHIDDQIDALSDLAEPEATYKDILRDIMRYIR